METTLKICTIGYGISSQEEFVNRLKTAFPDGNAIIVDIRKEGSGSYNAGNWANQGVKMGETCISSGNDYIPMPGLANEYGNTQAGLAKYGQELDRGDKREKLDEIVALVIGQTRFTFCLLCCERKPYKGTQNPLGWWSGKSNCHRTILAAEVTARIHYAHQRKCGVTHLYTEKR